MFDRNLDAYVQVDGFQVISDRAVYSWVGTSSRFNSIFLQAHLLAQTISQQLHVSTPILHPAMEGSRHALKGLNGSGMSLIWHYGGFDPDLIGVKYNPKTIFVYHNITPARFFWTTQPLVAGRSLLGRLQLLLLPKKCKWIAVSEYNAQELRRFGFADVSICPNIVVAESVGEVSKTEYFSSIFNGRIAPNKNCVVLLEQMAWVAERLAAPTELIVVGEVKRGCRFGKAFERKVAALSNHPWLRIDWRRGGVDSQELHALYKRSWLYVSMSLHEGFGLPVCEAIAQGTPALYLECGGTESVLEGHGMVPRSRTSEFWRRTVEILGSESEREGLLSNQRSIVRRYEVPEISNTVRCTYGPLL